MFVVAASRDKEQNIIDACFWGYFFVFLIKMQDCFRPQQ